MQELMMSRNRRRKDSSVGSNRAWQDRAQETFIELGFVALRKIIRGDVGAGSSLNRPGLTETEFSERVESWHDRAWGNVWRTPHSREDWSLREP
jgi:hypothetical protein